MAYLAALVAVSSERVPPGWDRAAARRLTGSGRGFLAQDALEYAQQQSDAVAVGGFLGRRASSACTRWGSGSAS